MTNLNEEDVRYLSGLCRIAVDEKDIPLICNDLQRILAYIAQLKEVDVSHLSPYIHVETQDLSDLREDEVKDLLPQKEFLQNAPDVVGGMIRVPPVISKEK